jgi:hypothetical protein
MRFRYIVAVLAVFAFTSAQPIQAQRAIDLTADLLDRFLTAYDTEQEEMKKVEPQLKEVDEKIRKFRDCKIAWDIAAMASGSPLGGLAASIAMRAKCGATNEDGFQRDRQRIIDGPEKAAVAAGRFGRVDDYRNLKYALIGYLHGGRSGFTKAGLDLLATRETELSSRMGIALLRLDAPVQAPGMIPGIWSMDYAWIFIGQLFAVQYMSGATIFEKPYTAGQWTKWEITTADDPKSKYAMERAFIGRTSDGGEWWRFKSLISSNRDGKDVVDTVVLEGLLKPQGESLKQLVRMRGKLPGNAEAQEMIVPQSFTVLPLSGSFSSRPTQESIDGATVGTETVGAFQAKHLKFGMGGGTLEWWLADTAPGGWVRFKVSSGDTAAYQMDLVGSGTGATSELGIRI